MKSCVFCKDQMIGQHMASAMCVLLFVCLYIVYELLKYGY